MLEYQNAVASSKEKLLQSQLQASNDMVSYSKIWPWLEVSNFLSFPYTFRLHFNRMKLED